jgi:hypothetical protein
MKNEEIRKLNFYQKGPIYNIARATPYNLSNHPRSINQRSMCFFLAKISQMYTQHGIRVGGKKLMMDKVRQFSRRVGGRARRKAGKKPWV